MSSTATAVILPPQQHGFRLSSVPSDRSWSEHAQSTRPSNRRYHPEMSSAAYFGQRPVGYETGGSNREPYSSMPTAGRPWTISKDPQNWHEDYPSYSQQGQVPQQRQQYQPPPQQQARHSVSHTMPHTVPFGVSRQSTRQSTPNSTHSSHPASGTSTNGDSQSMVLHSLQIPSRISKGAGNLADFSAQVCLAHSYVPGLSFGLTSWTWGRSRPLDKCSPATNLSLVERLWLSQISSNADSFLCISADPQF